MQGSVQGKGTDDAIFISRTIIERSLQVNLDSYLCISDYAKTFDRVKYEDLI